VGTSVDNRIVKMQFDNKQFESGCKTTLNTLDKLKQSLNFQGASDSLKNLASAVNNFSFSAMQKGVDVMTNKFSMLGTMTDQFIRRITDQLMNVGKMVASTFTIDPIKSGFEEYTTQINAVQTILANTQSKGTTIDQVNDALDELNHYADKTIYNFTEMTRNIGTFTAAGVDLDTSVTAIQGIANLAAVSGSTSQQASTAMYQLSQALAAGTVKLQDWNSVVNAGMGGQVFQDALKETAREFGVDIDQMIEDAGSFRETLQQGWLTSDVLTTTLAKFTDETTELGRTATDAATKVKTFSQLWDTMKEAVQSGWTETWEMIVGDYEEAKETLTDVNNFFDNLIQNYNNARNEQVKIWKQMGGREKLIKSFWNIIEVIKTAIVPVQKVISEFIPKYTAERLMAFTNGLEKLTAKMKMSGDTSQKVYLALKGLASILFTGKYLIGNIIKSLAPMASGVLPKILDLLAEIGSKVTNFLQMFVNTGAAINVVRFALEIFGNVLDIIRNTAKGVYVALKNVIPNKTFKMVQKLTKKMAQLGRAVTTIIDAKEVSRIMTIFSSLGEVVALVIDVFDAFLDSVDLNDKGLARLVDATLEFVAAISSVVGQLAQFIRKSGVLQAIVRVLCSALSIVIGILSRLAKAISTVVTMVVNFITKNKAVQMILTAVKKLIDVLVKAVVNLKDKVVDMFKQIHQSEGVQNLIEQMEHLWEVFGSLASSRIEKAAQNLDGFVNAGSSSTPFVNFVNLSSKLAGHLASIVSVLASGGNPFEKLVDGIKTGKLKGLMSIQSVYSWFVTTSKKGFVKTAMVELSNVVDGLFLDTLMKASDGISSFFSKIGETMTTTHWDKVMETITHVITGLTVVSTLKQVKKSVEATTKALNILSGFLGQYANIGANVNKLLTGWTNVAKTAQHTLRVKMFESIALGIAALAASLWIIAQIPADRLKASVETLSIIFAELVAAIGILSSPLFNEKKISSIGVAFAGIGIGLLTMIGAIKLITMLDASTIETGMRRILGVLVAFAVASRLAGKVSKTSAMILAMAVSVNLLMLPMYVLGKMDKATAIQGVTAVIAVMEGLALAARIGNTAGLDGKGGKGGGSFLAMAIAIDLIVPAISILGKMDREQAIQGSLIVVGVMESLAVAARIAGKNKQGLRQAIGVVLEIAAVTGSLYILSSLDQNSILAGAGCISAVMIAISAATRIMDTKNIVKQIALFTVMLGEVVGGLLLLNNLTNPESLKGIADTMAEILLSIAVSARIMGMLKASMLEGIAIGMVAVAGFITEFGGILVALATLDNVVSNATGGKYTLEGLLKQGLPLLQTIATAIGDFFGNILSGIVSGWLGGIGDGLPKIGKGLTDFWEEAKPFFMGVKTLSDDGILSGIGTLVSAFAAIFGAEFINTLVNNPLVTALNGGKNPLSELMKAIDVLVNGEDGEGGIKQFAKDCGEINSSDLEKASLAATALADIATAASKIPNEGGWLAKVFGENNIGGFVDKLPTVGMKLVAYARNVSLLTDEMMQQSSDVMDMLSKICKTAKSIPNSGGLIADLVGDNNIGDFVSHLPDVAVQLGAYAMGCTPISDDMIKRSKKVMSMLSNICETASQIPNSGGVLAEWVGDNDIGVFVENLPWVGTYFARYINNIKGISQTLLDKSDAVMTSLSNIITVASTIPNEGGIISWFTGDNKMDKFAQNLTSFAASFIEYLDYLDTNLNDPRQNKQTMSNLITETAQNIADMSMNLTSQGNARIALFGNNIKTFGSGMVTYLNGIADLTSDHFRISSSVVSAGYALNKFAIEVGAIDTTKLLAYAIGIKTFGRNIRSYYEAISGIDSTGLQSVTTQAGVLISRMVAMSNQIANAGDINTTSYDMRMFGARFQSFYRNITDTDASAVTSAVSSINKVIDSFKKMKEVDSSVVDNFGSSLKNIAKQGIDNFVKAFQDSYNQVSQAISGFITRVQNEINFRRNNVWNTFFDLGQFGSEGFESGLTSRLSFVSDAAREIANTALNSAQEALDSHSPSRETMKLGEYFSQGMAIGIMNLGDSVETAGLTIGDKAKMALAESLHEISAIANNDLSIDPTIRPTVDLGGVYSGASTAYGMWNATSTVMSRMASKGVNAMFTQEDTYDDTNIVNAIYDLKTDVQTLTQEMASMQMVMDTGAVVGQLAKPMNTALNKIAVYKSRRN